MRTAFCLIIVVECDYEGEVVTRFELVSGGRIKGGYEEQAMSLSE